MTTLAQMTIMTPEITLNKKKLKIVGNSYPFEPDNFWPTIIHQSKKINNLIVDVELNHVNTNSIYYLMLLFRLENVIEVNWVSDCDDEEPLDIKKLVGSKMNILDRELFIS